MYFQYKLSAGDWFLFSKLELRLSFKLFNSSYKIYSMIFKFDFSLKIVINVIFVADTSLPFI